MKLSEHQAIFSCHTSLTVLRFSQPPYRLVIGEVKRSEYQQIEHVANGVSWTLDSDHLLKLAVDFFLWIDGVYQSKSADYWPVARFWESLDPLNYSGLLRWGKDGHHMGRKRDLRSVPAFYIKEA